MIMLKNTISSSPGRLQPSVGIASAVKALMSDPKALVGSSPPQREGDKADPKVPLCTPALPEVGRQHVWRHCRSVQLGLTQLVCAAHGGCTACGSTQPDQHKTGISTAKASLSSTAPHANTFGLATLVIYAVARSAACMSRVALMVHHQQGCSTPRYTR